MKESRLALLIILVVAAAVDAKNPAPPPPYAAGPCAIAVSPDGKQVLIGLQGYRAEAETGKMALLQLWDTTTGKKVQAFAGHKHCVTYVAFLPDGKQVLSQGAGDNSFKLWDVQTGKEVRSFPVAEDKKAVGALAPDGKLLVVWEGDSRTEECRFKVWDVASGKVVKTFAIKGQMRVRSIAISPDNRFAFLSCWNTQTDNCSAKIVNIEKKRVAHSFNMHLDEKSKGAWCQVGAFTPDSKFCALEMVERDDKGLFTGAYLVLWDVNNDIVGKKFEQWRDKDRRGWASRRTAIDPKGRGIISIGTDNMIRFIDLTDGKETWAFPVKSNWDPAFVEDGKEWLLVVAGYPEEGKEEPPIFFERRETRTGNLLKEWRVPDLKKP